MDLDQQQDQHEQQNQQEQKQILNNNLQNEQPHQLQQDQHEQQNQQEQKQILNNLQNEQLQLNIQQIVSIPDFTVVQNEHKQLICVVNECKKVCKNLDAFDRHFRKHHSLSQMPFREKINCTYEVQQTALLALYSQFQNILSSRSSTKVKFRFTINLPEHFCRQLAHANGMVIKSYKCCTSAFTFVCNSIFILSPVFNDANWYTRNHDPNNMPENSYIKTPITFRFMWSNLKWSDDKVSKFCVCGGYRVTSAMKRKLIR